MSRRVERGDIVGQYPSTEGGDRLVVCAEDRITEILNRQNAVTGDKALCLGHLFGTSASFGSTCKNFASGALLRIKSAILVEDSDLARGDSHFLSVDQ